MPVVEVGGQSIQFREEGEGPAVCLLHCSSSHSGQWKPWFPSLTERACVLAPDLHGYGRSDPLPGDGPWWAADREIVAALSGYAGSPLHVIGHSLGGAAAVYAARAHPDRVASLTLIEPVLFGLLQEAGEPLFGDAWDFSEGLLQVLANGRNTDAARDFAEFWSGPDAFARLAPHQQDYMIRTIGRVGDDWRGLRSDLPEQLTLADIAALEHPVHLIKGGKSRKSARAVVDLLSDRLPNADLTVIPEADHMGAVMQPDLFLPVILDWLRPRLAA